MRLNYENHLETIKKIHALSFKDAEEIAYKGREKKAERENVIFET